MVIERNGIVFVRCLGWRQMSSLISVDAVCVVVVVFLVTSFVVVEEECTGTIWSVESSIFGVSVGFAKIVEDFGMMLLVLELLCGEYECEGIPPVKFNCDLGIGTCVQCQC